MNIEEYRKALITDIIRIKASDINPDLIPTPGKWRANAINITIKFEWTPKSFWALFPSVNLNFNSKEFEIEWLCMGVYFSINKYCL